MYMTLVFVSALRRDMQDRVLAETCTVNLFIVK